MNRKQVTDLLEKIQAYRQSFLITNSVIMEWSKVLEPYDCEDVNKKLDDYFKDGENFGRYPDVYYLTKYLKTSQEKVSSKELHVKCNVCGKIIKYADYAKHFYRCSSIEYICSMSAKYFNKNLSKEKLLSIDEEKLNNFYWNLCNKLYIALPDGILKKALNNSILTHEGKAPNLDLNEISEEMFK